MMEENDIFNASVLGFCSPLDYNLTYLGQARVILNKKYMVFQLRAVDETASEILGRTNQRILLRSKIESNSNQSMNASQDNPLIGKELLSQSNILISGIFILIVILAMAVVFVADSIMRKKKSL